MIGTEPPTQAQGQVGRNVEAAYCGGPNAMDAWFIEDDTPASYDVNTNRHRGLSLHTGATHLTPRTPNLHRPLPLPSPQYRRRDLQSGDPIVPCH